MDSEDMEPIIPQLWLLHNCGKARHYSLDMPYNATLALADNVRRLMQQEGLTLAALSARTGVSKSALGYLKNYRDRNDRHPTTETVESLAAAFGMEPWQLLAPKGTHAAPAPRKPATTPPVDAKLLADSLKTALSAFRSQSLMPSDAQLAAAASFVYAHACRGRAMQESAKAVQKMLDKAGATAFVD